MAHRQRIYLIFALQVILSTFCGGGTSTTGSAVRYFGLYNYQTDSSGVYRIGLAKSSNLRDWAIEAEPLIDVSASGVWDDETVKDPCIVRDDKGILYVYYSGYDGYVFKIGVALSYDGGETFAKTTSNPIITPTEAWEQTGVSQVWRPVVVYDRDESDPNKRFKMFFRGGGSAQIGYAYSADGIAFTKYASNPVITDFGPHCFMRRGDGWITFTTKRLSGVSAMGLATADEPEGPWTHNFPVLSGDQIDSALTDQVDPGETTINVISSSDFVVGMPVWVYDDDDRFLAVVTGKPSSSSITIEARAPRKVSTTMGGVRSVAYGAVNPNAVLYDDGWIIAMTVFQPWGNTGELRELSMLAYADPALDNFNFDYGAGVIIPISKAEGQLANISRENLWLLDVWEMSRREAAEASTIDSDEKSRYPVTTARPDV